MKKEIKLLVFKRTEENGRLSQLRQNDYLPAIVYGSGSENKKIKIKKKDFEKVFKQVGESQLVDLVFEDGQSPKVIIKDIQKEPIKDEIIHIDFYQVDMSKKIEIEIPINFVNEAPAVKELGGTLVKNIDAIEARCLPGDLLDKIDLDLSSLKTYEDYVRIKDLDIPENIEIISDPESIITHVIEPEKEEEIKTEEAPEGEAEVEEGKGKEGESPDQSAGGGKEAPSAEGKKK